MNIQRCLARLFVCFGLAFQGFADMSEVKEPSFGFPDSFPTAARDQITAALRRPDCQFLGGTSFFAGTILRYHGETVPLNLFLESLVACPGITVSLRFNTPENANYDWAVEQDGFEPTKLCVRVNLKSERIKVESLIVPDRQGPSLAGAK
jgi:hypothetical protein